MKKKYFTFFDNFFLGLRLTRPEYKEQAQHLLRAVREADLGPALEAECVALEAKIDVFDENLAERQAPTQGDTTAYHTARQEWLDFVEDTYIDFVLRKLRKLPVFKSFKPFGKAKLDALKQDDLLVKSAGLIQLYADNQAAMDYPTLAKDAQKKLDAVAAIDEIRDTKDGATYDTILDLADDKRGIALAQRRLKAQLELTFDDPARVYSFFNFSKAYQPKEKKKDDGTTPT